tara:strand:- start:391 stop:615 length:225 start_codon:yes stop_codon:yes gene_type:complete
MTKSKRKTKAKLTYEVKMSKRSGKIRWLVIERPTGSIVAEKLFEDEAKEVAHIQESTQQWAPQGVVKHLTLGKI